MYDQVAKGYRLKSKESHHGYHRPSESPSSFELDPKIPLPAGHLQDEPWQRSKAPLRWLQKTKSSSWLWFAVALVGLNSSLVLCIRMSCLLSCLRRMKWLKCSSLFIEKGSRWGIEFYCNLQYIIILAMYMYTYFIYSILWYHENMEQGSFDVWLRWMYTCTWRSPTHGILWKTLSVKLIDGVR